MTQFQLEIGIFLCCCAVVSSLFFYRATRPEDSKIALPIRNGSLGHEDEREVDDPFNVTTPEDMVDGFPIREEEFWRKVRMLSMSFGYFSFLCRCAYAKSLSQQSYLC